MPFQAQLAQKYNAHSMDQTRDIFGLNSNKNSIDNDDNNDDVVVVNHINEVIINKNEKKKVARKRWAILAKALKSPVGSEPSSPTDEFSLRRISSFMLLQTQQLPTITNLINLTKFDQLIIDQINKRTWYRYLFNINNIEYELKIGHRNRTFSAEDLMGFNNTGNICIWPSEETLSYYICTNLDLFNGKYVLELGGGMSCLAGLFIAKYTNARNVVVTDGNKISIENVQISLYLNQFNCPIECKTFKWNCIEQYHNYKERYDLILCADCLFFDDARNDLIDCLWNCLTTDGLALIMAPKRGNTLENFIAQSILKGFKCRKIMNYNQIVWEKRLDLVNNCDYDDNIHYPILIEVTKF